MGDNEVMKADTGSLLNWARELLLPRVKRSAEGGLRRRKRASIRSKKGSKGKKSKGKKSKNKKRGKKRGKKSGGKKKKEKSKSKGGSRSPEKSGGSGLDQEVYNQLWCADLAVEKALRRCAMKKILGEI